MLKTFNFKSTLKSKIQLNAVTFEFKYTAPSGFEFKPGQFVVLLINKPSGIVRPPSTSRVAHRRSYSVVEIKDGLMTLLVDVRPMGPASQYFIDTKVGDETVIMGPYGLYALQESPLHKVFIATSTGIAPLLPMVKKLIDSRVPVDFFYGARFLKDDIAYGYLKEFEGDNFSYTRCITHPENSDPQNISVFFELGRVTEVVPTKNYDYKNTEFYVCGSPKMVENMREILKNLGADKVYFEKY